LRQAVRASRPRDRVGLAKPGSGKRQTPAACNDFLEKRAGTSFPTSPFL